MKKALIFILFSILSYSTVAQLPTTLPAVSGSSFINANGTDGVYASARDASGNLYIGGDFSTVGAVSRKGIAKINADGTVSSWNPFNAFSDVIIYTMTISGNTLFVGGGRSSGPFFGVFAAFDISSSSPALLAGAWNLAFDGQITKLYVATTSVGTRLFAAGGFTNVNNGANVARNNFATFNVNATSLSNVLITSGFVPTFDALGYGTFAYDATADVLYVGGEFTTVNGSAVTNGATKTGVVGLSASTGARTTFNHNFTVNGATPFKINDLKIFNSNLYVAGSFTNVDGSATPIRNVASFDITTAAGTLRNWNANINSSSTSVNKLQCASSSTNLLLGGVFSQVNGSTRQNFAVVSTTDGSLQSFSKDVSNSFSNAVVYDFSPVVNNEVMLTGTFVDGGSYITKTNFLISQTITFNALTAKNYGDADFTISATSTNSTIPITFTSSDATVATVTGTTVHIVKAGTVTITAKQAGDATYAAATDVPQTLTINKANQTITFGSLVAKNYNDAAFTLSASASSGLTVTYVSSDPTVASVSGNSVTILKAGSTTITAKQAGDANYNAATDVPQTLIVNKINQTISGLPATIVKTIGDAAFTLSASASSGLTVTYVSDNTSVATVSGNTVTIVAVGTANITASQIGSVNYNAATPVVAALTVNSVIVKQNQTITFASLPQDKFVGELIPLNATASSGLVVTYTSSDPNIAEVIGNSVKLKAVGVATITASQAGDANYNAALNVTQNITANAIPKQNQTISFGTLPMDRIVGDELTLSATASSGLVVTYTSSDPNIAEVTGNVLKLKNAGTATITASQAGNGSYNAATPVVQSILVNAVITGIVDAERPTLSAYPNPTTDYINIQTASNKAKTIAIYNMGGQMMESLTAGTESMVQVNVSSYNNGMYIVKIADADNTSATLKFIKK